jgi:hypothetical protein
MGKVEMHRAPGVPGLSDPMLFSDDNGRLYLYFGTTASGGIWGVELDADRPTRTVVRRPYPLEVGQHMLRAVRRPHAEPTMIVVLEGPATAHRDEPRVPDLGEDHP